MAVSMKSVHVVAALALCTACGLLPKGGIASKTVDQIGSMTGLKPAPAPAAPEIPADALAKGPGNVLIVTLMARDTVLVMTRAGTNNGVDTWRTDQGITLSFQDGILVASRGLNEDLMGADVTGVHDAVIAGKGLAQRRHAFLDSEDQIVTRDLACVITTVGDEDVLAATGPVPAIKILEACSGKVLSIKNTYWIDAVGGTILQSQQALAPGVGFVKVNSL